MFGRTRKLGLINIVPRGEQERSFVLLTLKYLKPVFSEIARDKQTTGLGHVTVSDLKRLHVVLPPNLLLEGWRKLVDPLLERAFLTDRHSRTLAALRDSLLPKLISGQIRVGEVDKMVEKTL